MEIDLTKKICAEKPKTSTQVEEISKSIRSAVQFSTHLDCMATIK